MNHPTRAELERAAIEAGHAADIAFSNVCRSLGLQFYAALAAPLHSIIVAEADKAAV